MQGRAKDRRFPPLPHLIGLLINLSFEPRLQDFVSLLYLSMIQERIVVTFELDI